MNAASSVELPAASGGELGDFADALRRQAWLLLLVAALVAVVGTAVVLRRPASWTSTASLLVPADGEGAGARSDSVVDLNTERQVLRSETVATVAAERLAGEDVGLEDVDPRDLAAHIAVEVPVDTRVLRLTATGDSAAQARSLARAFVSAYRDLRYLQGVADRNGTIDVLDRELAEADEDLQAANDDLASAAPGSVAEITARSRRSLVIDRIGALQEDRGELLAGATPQVRVLSPAGSATTTGSDVPVRDLALVVLAALVLGAVAAVVRDRFDDRVREPLAVEDALGAPLLAAIPAAASSTRSEATELVVVDDPTGPAADAYRQLRVGVLGSPEIPGGTLLLAGVRGGEGVAGVAANLAMALAATGRSVAVVTIDDERPGVADRFDVDGPGLAEVLSGELALPDAVRRPRWLPVTVLPRGRRDTPVGDLLQSEAMHRLHRTLRAESNFVVLAAPPVLAAADAVALASLCDAAVVVASPRRTRRRDLRAVRARLGRVGFPVLGAVLHGTPPASPGADGAPVEDGVQAALPPAPGDEAAEEREGDEEAPVQVGARH